MICQTEDKLHCQTEEISAVAEFAKDPLCHGLCLDTLYYLPYSEVS